MAWQTRVNTTGANTTGGYVTWTLPSIAVRLPSVWDLQPGDILDYPSHHVILFTGWRDRSKGIFSFIQQTAPGLDMLMEDTESVLTGNIAGYPYNVFTPYRYVNIVSSGASGVRGDFDSDGAVDILATSGDRLYFYEGNGHGGFAFGHAAPVSSGMSGYVSVTRSPSLSSGSRAPYLVALDTTGTLWLLPTTGYGSFGPRSQIGTGFAGDQIVAPGDVTGDGRSDLLVVSPAGAMQLYAENGHSFAPPVRVWGNWSGLRLRAAGDLTGDGRPDVHATTAGGSLLLYAGSATHVLASPRAVGHGWAAAWKLAAVGDWTGDHRQDLLAVDPSGELWVYPGSGTGGFGARVHLASHWGAMTLL
jgi:hypothetical protein